jgi:hypothetical protein
MPNRFHSKQHRFSHHTSPTNNLNWPDTAQDPIASHDSPFYGDLVMLGTLSATPTTIYSSNSALAAFFKGNVGITKTLSTDNIVFTGDVIRIPAVVSTSAGKILVLKIINEYYGIRLWDLPLMPIPSTTGTSSITSLSLPPGSFILST